MAAFTDLAITWGISLSMGLGLMGICDTVKGLEDTAEEAFIELYNQAASGEGDPAAVDEILGKVELDGIEGQAWALLENIGVADGRQLRSDVDVERLAASAQGVSEEDLGSLPDRLTVSLEHVGVALDAMMAGDAEKAQAEADSADFRDI